MKNQKINVLLFMYLCCIVLYFVFDFFNIPFFGFVFVFVGHMILGYAYLISLARTEKEKCDLVAGMNDPVALKTLK